VELSTLGDRYRVEARIGAGGMAEVYRGVDPVLNRTVAIKVLLPQYARDAGFVARFRREAQAAARLNDPRIVGVYDSGSDGDTQWIVMEFIEGRTLADFLGSGKRPTPIQSAQLCEEVGGALSTAHAQGVVHRDIKPGNIMITRDGSVKVMDFGIARVTTGVETAPQTSQVLGTASYLSPEQAQGEPVDARTDIYSLGVVLYELLTGRPPFKGESPMVVAYKQVHETPQPPSTLNPNVPPALDAVTMKALSKNPANRYQTAEAMAEDLRRVREGEPVEATPLLAGAGEATQVIARPNATQVLPPTEEPPGSGRKVWLGILIGVAVVAILGAGGWLLANTLTGEDTTTKVIVPGVVGLEANVAQDRLEQLKLKVEIQERVAPNKDPGIVLDQDPPEGAEVDEGSTVTLVVAKAPATVEVPDLTGMTLGEAQSALADVGLILGSKESAPSSDVEVDRIIAQSEAPGSQVEKGTIVDVVVSSGPELITLPDEVCRPISAAQNELRNLGLNVVIGGTAPPPPECSKNSNRVAAMDPAAGTQLLPGDTVTLFTPGVPTTTPTGSPT
jgi:serine/threonine-protein kinase